MIRPMSRRLLTTLPLAVFIVVSTTGCGSSQPAAPAPKQAVRSGRAARLKRNRQELFAFARKRIAEDRSEHRVVSVHQIVAEYDAAREVRRHREGPSTMTVGSVP